MHMMTSTGAVIALMTFLILVLAGLLFAVRAIGANEVKDDHPR